jgi:hypothetical protein
MQTSNGLQSLIAIVQLTCVNAYLSDRTGYGVVMLVTQREGRDWLA